MADIGGVMKSVVDLWLKQVELCEKRKHKDFGATAALAWKFLGKKYDDVLFETSEGSGDADETGFMETPRRYRKPTLNKSREFVALYTPAIHNKVPNRIVSPRRPQMPAELSAMLNQMMAMQQQQAMVTGAPPDPGIAQLAAAGAAPKPEEILRSWLLQWWLNYLPTEYNLVKEARLAIQEALVKGRGCVWIELYETQSGKVPASFYDTVDNLLIDADSQTYKDAGFIIRKRIRSAWQIADDFGIPVEDLRGKYESNWRQGENAARNNSPDNREQGGDLCVYYEVWSRMGFGQKLVDAKSDLKDEETAAALESAGNNVWLCIMPGVPYPLNMRPELFGVQSSEEILGSIEWPVKTYEDIANPWPCVPLDFYPDADTPWASSPLEGGLPMQVFLDMVYRYVKNRVKATTRNLYIVHAKLAAAIKDLYAEGVDQEMVETDFQPGEIEKLFHVVEFPTINADLWRMVQLAEEAFERATGMSPLLYGGSPPTQDRSAAATRAREGHLTSRPDDFADTVENWMSQIASKEGLVSRLVVEPRTVATLFGEQIQPVDPATIPPEMAAVAPTEIYGPLTNAWVTLVSTDDPAVAAMEVSYTVEAGTGRKKNKQAQSENATLLVQNFVQPAFTYGTQTGNFDAFNALVAVTGEWLDIPLNRLYLQNVQLQAPAPPGEEGEAPPPEGNQPEGEPVNAGV